LRLNPPTDGIPWDDLRKIFSKCQWMASVPNGEEKLPKMTTLQTTDRQTTDGTAIAYSERGREFTFAKNRRD